MKADDIFAFHNLTFHGSLMNQSDDIRWSTDLPYSETGRPLERLFKAGLNGFIARSHENPETVDSWVDWQAKRRSSGFRYNEEQQDRDKHVDHAGTTVIV